jgi:hypothetical protein
MRTPSTHLRLIVVLVLPSLTGCYRALQWDTTTRLTNPREEQIHEGSEDRIEALSVTDRSITFNVVETSICRRAHFETKETLSTRTVERRKLDFGWGIAGLSIGVTGIMTGAVLTTPGNSSQTQHTGTQVIAASAAAAGLGLAGVLAYAIRRGS